MKSRRPSAAVTFTTARPPVTTPPRAGGAGGQTAYIALPKRDRDAIKQSQGDKVPQEYGPMVEQYLRNLADEPSK